MKPEARIKQSEVRVKSVVKLILFFALVAAAAWFFAVLWLAKLAGVLACFFVVVTLAEFVNAWRLKREIVDPTE